MKNNKEYITVIAREWNDKNGNTYHTVEILGGNVVLRSTRIEQGYGLQFLTTANELLEKYGDSLDNYNCRYTTVQVKDERSLLSYY